MEWGDPVRYLARYRTGFPAGAWLFEARPERERDRERERETLLGNREGFGKKYPGAQECRVGGKGV